MSPSPSRRCRRRRRRRPAKLVFKGPPSEPLLGSAGTLAWPPGWVKKVFKRRGGKYRGAKKDKYWFSPQKKFRLRSMPEVRRFLQELSQADGDESLARRRMVQSKSAEKIDLPEVIDLTSVSTDSLSDTSTPVLAPPALPFDDELSVWPRGGVADLIPDDAPAFPSGDELTLFPLGLQPDPLWTGQLFSLSDPAPSYPYIEGYALQLYQCTTDLAFDMAGSISKAYPDWQGWNDSSCYGFRKACRDSVREFLENAIGDVIKVFDGDTEQPCPASMQEQTDDMMKQLKWESIFDESVQPYKDEDATSVDRVSISMSVLRETVPDLVFEILRAVAPQVRVGASLDLSPSSIRWSVREICNIHVPRIVQRCVHDLVLNMCPHVHIGFTGELYTDSVRSQADDVTQELGWSDYVREHD